MMARLLLLLVHLVLPAGCTVPRRTYCTWYVKTSSNCVLARTSFFMVGPRLNTAARRPPTHGDDRDIYLICIRNGRLARPRVGDASLTTQPAPDTRGQGSGASRVHCTGVARPARRSRARRAKRSVRGFFVRPCNSDRPRAPNRHAHMRSSPADRPNANCPSASSSKEAGCGRHASICCGSVSNKMCTLDRWIIMSCPRPWTLLQSAGVARRSTVPPLLNRASLGRSVGCPHSLRADAARRALQPHARRSAGFQNATRAAALAIRRRQAVCARRQPVAAGTAGRRRVRFDGRRRAGGARARYARCGGRRLPLVRGRGTPLAGSPVHHGAGWQTLVQSGFGRGEEVSGRSYRDASMGAPRGHSAGGGPAPNPDLVP